MRSVRSCVNVEINTRVFALMLLTILKIPTLIARISIRLKKFILAVLKGGGGKDKSHCTTLVDY